MNTRISKYASLALLFPALALGLSSCSDDDEIVFPHEEQAFETRSDRILVEAIMPSGTADDDEIYIVGDFNGGADAAVGSVAYQMEHSSVITEKWGVYLDPSAFVSGKTLADGFTFVSVSQGAEKSVKNEDVSHTLKISAGQWANVYVDRWAKYFEKQDSGDDDIPAHDGYIRIWVNDQTSWGGAVALYMWGSVNDLGGSWPGMQPTGSATLSGTSYIYFDYATADITGLDENLIFNNNGGGTQLADYAISFDGATADYFLVITDEGCTAEDRSNIPAHDGYIRVWVYDQTSWGGAVALYMWGSVNDFGGAWPGMQPTGTATVGSKSYIYFDYATADITGLDENLIFNNNGGGTQLADYAISFDGATVDYFLVITDDGCAAEGGDTPTPEPVVEKDKIYVLNETGWTDLTIYSYDAEGGAAFGEWPGAASSGTETIEGVDYEVFEFVKSYAGTTVSLIFSKSGAAQFDGPAGITLASELFVNVKVTNESEILTDPRRTFKVYVKDESGWGDIALYAWGDAEIFGGWPGAVPSSTVSLCGDTYKVFDVPAGNSGKTEHFIFNNNNGGTQFDAQTVTLSDDIYMSVTSSSYTLLENPGSRLYFEDQSGWSSLYCYIWGDGELYGAWPGKPYDGEQAVNGVTYKYFNVAASDAGKSANPIVNNNSGSQFDVASGITLGEDYFFTITSTGVTAR